MPHRLIIFDNDGVLVDSEPGIRVGQTLACNAVGVTFNPAWETALRGKRPPQIVETIRQLSGVAFTDAAFFAAYDTALEDIFRACGPTPGVLTVLGQLQQQQRPYCMGTSGRRHFTHVKNTAAGIAPFFPDGLVFTGEQVPHGKPAPDLFLFAAAQMGFAANQCVVVEDAVTGVQAAVAAGMPVLGYIGADHDGVRADLLRQAGANTILEHHDQLLEAIDALG